MALPLGVTPGKYISTGNRIVHRIDGTNNVIKLGCPLDYRSGGQNVIEAETWERLKDTNAAKYLNPVIEFDPNGEWLIAPFVRSMPRHSNYYIELDKVTNVLVKEHGLDGGDFSRDNVFVTPKNEIVVIDYGYSYDEWTRRRQNTNYCGECSFCKLTGRRKECD